MNKVYLATILLLINLSSTSNLEAKSNKATASKAKPTATSSFEKSWNSRARIIKDFQKQLKKTAWRYRSAIRKGQHTYLEKSLSSLARSMNKKLKSRKASLRATNLNNQTIHVLNGLTAFDAQSAFEALTPYQQEAIEKSFFKRGVFGKLLYGQLMPIEGTSSSKNRIKTIEVIDLVRFKRAKSRSLHWNITHFIEAHGRDYFALIIPGLHLPNKGYEAGDTLIVEQKKDGSLVSFQNRFKTGNSEEGNSERFTDQKIFFISKADLTSPISEDTKITHFAIDQPASGAL